MTSTDKTKQIKKTIKIKEEEITEYGIIGRYENQNIFF